MISSDRFPGISPESVAFYKRNGYVLIEDFIPSDKVEDLRARVLAHVSHHETIHVAQGTGRQRSEFFTFNGRDVDNNLPQLSALYDQVNEAFHRAGLSDFGQIGNRRVGLSVNIVTTGGTFSSHFDRHAFTCVLYLSTIEGGEMVFHPRVRRILPDRYTNRVVGFCQRVIDRILSLRRKLGLIGTPKVVKPTAGLLLAFEGNRCLHGVRPPQPGSAPRLSVQFAYDEPGVDYPESISTDYYGYGGKGWWFGTKTKAG